MRTLSTSTKNGHSYATAEKQLLAVTTFISDKSVGFVAADCIGVDSPRFHAVVALHPDDMHYAVRLASSGIFVFNL